jgi:hypothetical protein
MMIILQSLVTIGSGVASGMIINSVLPLFNGALGITTATSRASLQREQSGN